MDKSILYTGKEMAEYYVKYRPTYNTKLFETIVEFYERDKGQLCNFDLAVDVGCGPGQSTLPLAKYFNHVIGVDISTEMLAHAPKDVDRVEFKLGVGEDLHFLQDESVDLITAGAAFHWLDHGKFNNEVKRVLKPGGVLAVYCYRFPTIEKDAGNEALLEYQKKLSQCWMLDTYKMEELYGRLPHPFACETRKYDGVDMTREVTVTEFVGLLLSFHDWWLYKKDNPHADDIQKLQARLEEIFYEENSVMKLTYPFGLVIGRKPL